MPMTNEVKNAWRTIELYLYELERDKGRPLPPVDVARARRRMRNFIDGLDDIVANMVDTKLPQKNSNKPSEQQGLYQKFAVCRTDGKDARGEKHFGCRYFVLDLDHDPYAGVALGTYALACHKTHERLAEDLIRKYGATVLRASYLHYNGILLSPSVTPGIISQMLDSFAPCTLYPNVDMQRAGFEAVVTPGEETATIRFTDVFDIYQACWRNFQLQRIKITADRDAVLAVELDFPF